VATVRRGSAGVDCAPWPCLLVLPVLRLIRGRNRLAREHGSRGHGRGPVAPLLAPARSSDARSACHWSRCPRAGVRSWCGEGGRRGGGWAVVGEERSESGGGVGQEPEESDGHSRVAGCAGRAASCAPGAARARVQCRGRGVGVPAQPPCGDQRAAAPPGPGRRRAHQRLGLSGPARRGLGHSQHSSTVHGAGAHLGAP